MPQAQPAKQTSKTSVGPTRMGHHLESPFSAVSWPEISPENQEALLELLCSLLSPIGSHRRAHSKPSKGKRAKKRKLDNKQPLDSQQPYSRPLEPELCSHIDVGFNSITRHLAASACAKTLVPDSQPASSEASDHYALICVARGDQSAAFNCHFPPMVGVASHKLPEDKQIRLVGLSKSSSERLSACLGLARVSSVAIRNSAPGVDALLSLAHSVVPKIDIPWLSEDLHINYEKTVVVSKEVAIGVKRPKYSEGR